MVPRVHSSEVSGQLHGLAVFTPPPRQEPPVRIELETVDTSAGLGVLEKKKGVNPAGNRTTILPSARC